MFLRQIVLAVTVMSLGCFCGAAAQSNRYIEMELGMNAAPALVAHGSDNDWGTKCDLIINPLGLETGSECAVTPPLTSWTNAFGRGEDIRYTVTTGDNGFWSLGVSLKYPF